MTELDPQLLRRMKAELRKRLRGLRGTLPASACAARSQAIVQALLARPEIERARHVASFWPIEARHEVDMRPLDAALRERGVSMYYPAIDPDTGVMTFRLTAAPTELEERGYGFEEPAADAPAAGALDVVVVPCLGAGPDGHRLGYGAGYYDRTLPRYAPPAWSVAVLYDFQLLAEMPHGELDVPVSALCTDRRVLVP